MISIMIMNQILFLADLMNFLKMNALSEDAVSFKIY